MASEPAAAPDPSAQQPAPPEAPQADVPAAEPGPAAQAAPEPVAVPTETPSADAAAFIAEAERGASEITAPRATEPAAPDSVPEPPARVAAAELSIASIVEVWPAVIETAAADSSMLGAALGSARPVELVDGALVIAFPPNEVFNRRIAAENAEHKRILGEAIAAFTGTSVRLSYEIREIEGPVGPAPLAGDELVARLVQEFDAEENSRAARAGESARAGE